MKKRLIIAAAAAALFVYGAASDKPAQNPEQAEPGKTVVFEAPPVWKIRQCLGTIFEAAHELADGFSVRETPKEDGTPGDNYIIYFGTDEGTVPPQQ